VTGLFVAVVTSAEVELSSVRHLDPTRVVSNTCIGELALSIGVLARFLSSHRDSELASPRTSPVGPYQGGAHPSPIDYL
jgi:hypothetical protein